MKSCVTTNCLSPPLVGLVGEVVVEVVAAEVATTGVAAVDVVAVPAIVVVVTTEAGVVLDAALATDRTAIVMGVLLLVVTCFAICNFNCS